MPPRIPIGVLLAFFKWLLPLPKRQLSGEALEREAKLALKGAKTSLPTLTRILSRASPMDLDTVISESSQAIDWHEVARQASPRLVIVGPAGSGKSVLLEQLERLLPEIDRKASRKERFVVRACAADWQYKDDLVRFARRAFDPRVGRDEYASALFEGMLANGRLYLLVDGFDELGDSERARLLYDELGRIHDDNYSVIITTRPGTRLDVAPPGFIGAKLQSPTGTSVSMYLEDSGGLKPAMQDVGAEELPQLPLYVDVALTLEKRPPALDQRSLIKGYVKEKLALVSDSTSSATAAWLLAKAQEDRLQSSSISSHAVQPTWLPLGRDRYLAHGLVGLTYGLLPALFCGMAVYWRSGSLGLSAAATAGLLLVSAQLGLLERALFRDGGRRVPPLMIRRRFSRRQYFALSRATPNRIRRRLRTNVVIGIAIGGVFAVAARVLDDDVPWWQFSLLSAVGLIILVAKGYVVGAGVAGLPILLVLDIGGRDIAHDVGLGLLSGIVATVVFEVADIGETVCPLTKSGGAAPADFTTHFRVNCCYDIVQWGALGLALTTSLGVSAIVLDPDSLVGVVAFGTAMTLLGILAYALVSASAPLVFYVATSWRVRATYGMGHRDFAKAVQDLEDVGLLRRSGDAGHVRFVHPLVADCLRTATEWETI